MSRAITLWSIALWACADASAVSVGERTAVVDLERCGGSGIDCSTSRTPSTIHVAAALDLASAMRCVPIEEEPLRPRWTRELSNARCAPLGFCRPSVMEFASDGSLWAFALGSAPLPETDRDLSGVFLAHYANDGELLAENVLETWEVPSWSSPVAHSVALGPTRTGELVMAFGWAEQEVPTRPALVHASLATYDEGVTRVGEPTALLHFVPGVDPQLAIDAKDGVLLLFSEGGWMTTFRADGSTERQAGRAALAKLDASLEVEWQHGGASRAVDRLLQDRQGRAVIVGEPREAGLRAVTWFDARGNIDEQLDLAKDTRVLSAMLADGILVADDAEVAGEARAAVVYRALGRDGAQRWASRIVAPFEFPFVFNRRDWMADDGTIFQLVQIASGPDDPQITHVLLSLEPSGETCRFTRIEGLRDGLEIEQMFASERGEFFYQARRTDAHGVYDENAYLELGKLERK
jgi:hypothetical protein